MVSTLTSPFSGGEVVSTTLERAFMVRLNTGSTDNGFLICNFCGFGVESKLAWPSSHINPMNSRPCSGGYANLALAHKFQTDVARIEFPVAWGNESTSFATAESVMYAVLNGAANSLQISPNNIEATITQLTSSRATLNIVDTVPGGAGYAKLIAKSIVAVLTSALDIVSRCECGEETSCYMCLRSYSNQRVHDELSRGSAKQFLERLLLSPTGESTESLAESALTRWNEVILLGNEGLGELAIGLQKQNVPVPIVGIDIGPNNEWMIELSWPSHKVCVTTDLDSERDSWLREEGWSVVPATPHDDLEGIQSKLVSILSKSI